MIHTTRKAMEELGEKASQEERASVEAAVSDLENAVKGENKDDIKAKLDALIKVMTPISQRVYQEAAKQQQAKGGESEEKNDQEEFVDADYKIVDDDDDKK